MKISDWIMLGLFLAGFGWAGSNDFDYRCKQAHDMNKNETCKMIARVAK